jgi:hypothetical protein
MIKQNGSTPGPLLTGLQTKKVILSDIFLCLSGGVTFGLDEIQKIIVTRL